MPTIKTLAVVIMSLVVTLTHGDGVKRVGVFKDARSHISDGMLLTMTEAGYETEILTQADLQHGDKLRELDVLFLPGGWNAIKFAGFRGRLNMIDFVAQGKGILAAAFRSGYVRTGNRPLFPQIGVTDNRVNGTGVFPQGSSPILAGVSGPFYVSAWDHMIIKPGPRGEIFLTDSSGLPVGVAGEIHGGRYIAMGAFIGSDAKKEPMRGDERALFLNCIAWLAGAPEIPVEEVKANRRAAELEFLRREKIYDYTLNERGPDFGPGIIVELRNLLATPLQTRKYRLAAMMPYLSGTDSDRAGDMIGLLTRALDELDRNYRELTAKQINVINASSREELIADNPFFNKEDVLRMIAEKSGKSEEEKQAVENVIDEMYRRARADNAPKITAKFLYDDTIRAELFDESAITAMTEAADDLLTELEPRVMAARTAERNTQEAADRAAVPGLIEQCSASDAARRRHAALELGRIGDRRAVAALIKMLNDPDEKTRTNAILALGWMQAEAAVPALIEAAGGADKWIRRRAVQALGQIGDRSAVGVLLKSIKSGDYYTRENAVLALGWLKAVEAVPVLIEIVTDYDRQDPEQRDLMKAAIRALGHIGDDRALPQLEYWAEHADDFPAPRQRGRRITNVYATPQCLGLQGHAELAIEQIRRGGRPEAGIRQADFLARHDKFYGITRHFNFFVGRIHPLLRSNFSEEPDALFDHVRAAGATGVHNAWGQQDDDPDEYIRLLKQAAERDLKWIEVMPIGGNVFGHKRHYPTQRQQRTLDKAGADLVLFKVSDISSFQGFWSEEDYPLVEMENADFENFLRQKYGANYRETLGANEDTAELLPPRGQRGGWRIDRGREGLSHAEHFVNARVFAEFLEFAGKLLLEHWREAQEWLHGVRKGCAFTFNVTTGQRFAYPGVAGGAGGIIDAHGPQTYQSFGSDNAFMMELNKDGEARPILSEFYNWYCPSPEHAARGFAQHLMHGECFFNFALPQIFEQANYYYMWSWDAQRWEKASDIFLKAQKLKEYLAVPASAANVALAASERSAILFYAKQYGERVPMARRYYQHQSGLWSALQQSQIPADAIWTETMTPEKLRRYRVLLLTDAKSLTPDEEGLIRQWVGAGGILIAGGTTSLFDQWAEQRDNYALSDVFGLDYAGYAGAETPGQNDTYGFDRGRPPFLILPEQIRYHVRRDIKPEKSIGIYIVDDEFALNETVKGLACEYDMPLGYDRIKPVTARTLARFSNGDPALTVNKFGEGLCYFWAPIYPGLCYVASEWQMQEHFKDFWPGTRELLGAMIKGGLRMLDARLPVEAASCPKDVAITVREQPELNRRMIHLLNLDPNSSRVRGVALDIANPGRDKMKISYPDNGEAIPFRRIGDRLIFTTRDFEVHDMILLEY